MCEIIHLPNAKSRLTKTFCHEEQERLATDALITFYDKTIAFFNNNPPGQLVKDLHKLLFALVEHQANNNLPVNFAASIYDIKQLLQLLEEADRLQQQGDLYSQHFFNLAEEFMHENNPVNLSCNLCRILLEFIKYELQIGYPTFINKFLPNVLALLEWLHNGATLVNNK
ncbi:hypothetical protein [Niastella populi]|uniref:Uncharacterized protein n=1 Tax=Niastella populi TaxID=550983 RepID=A0A1V9FT97_9BACT|nr:hypothetical protein [Niastella populi]OQP61572.1 hypothetical protein A4R26_18565 [Niastella populi]